MFTDEWRKKLSEAKSKSGCDGEKNNFYGKKHSVDSKRKMSNSKKGKFDGEKNPFYGKQHTDENRKMFAETAKKTFTGKPKSKEQKLKMSQAAKGRKNM